MAPKLKLQPTQYHGLIVVAEPATRRAIAAKYKLPSGCIPVLISIAAQADLDKTRQVSAIYAQKLASQTLIRRYVAALKKAGLVERYTLARTSRVRLTLDGMGVVFAYHSELRAGVRKLLA